ncbi:MAG: hypothetical protein V3574_03875 [Candidatus Moraniibacteriota bacterium]
MLKQNLKIIFILGTFFIFPNLVWGAPSISGVSGNLSDGQNVTIAGNSFGSHDLNIEWLGGSSGLIESGTSGQIPIRSNWNFGTSWADTYFSDDYVHSGTKSLKVSTNNTNYNGDIRYDSGINMGPGEDIFVSWWVRREHSGTGQWKMFRLDFENDITDGPYQLVMFNWDTQQQFIVRPGPSIEENSWQDWSPPYPSQDNRWYRLDLSIHISDYGVSNGSYSMDVQDPVSGGFISNMTLLNKLSFIDSNGFYRWFLWQNYAGNGVISQTTWFDDIYIQVGTQARVEIGDASTWSNCTFKEMQPPASWNNSQILINLNKGSFSNGETAYLYVVDENGDFNETGYPITFAADSGDIIPPAAPVNLSVL